MTILVLVRHGHVEGIAPPRFRGRTDVPLSPTGEAQARLTAERIARSWRPAVVHASPLARCISTASAIAAATGAAVATAADLTDLDYGDWRWQTHDAVKRGDPERYARWHDAPDIVRFPNGESLQDMAARTADMLRAVVGRDTDGTVVLVGHDSTNRVLLTQLLGLPLSAYWRLAQDPCAISVARLTEGRAQLLLMNDVSHLAALAEAAVPSRAVP